MARLFLYIVFITICFGLKSQTLNVDSIFTPPLCGEIYHIKTGTIGNQFYNNEWRLGKIKLISGEWVFNIKLKYNSFIDELIWLQENSFKQIKLEKHFIDEFVLINSDGISVHFRRMKIKLPPMVDSSEIYVEVLLEKIASLYVFRSIKIEGHEEELKNGILYSNDVLKDHPVYILIMPDQRIITFQKIRKRSLLNALDENSRVRIKKIIQEFHLSIRKENDLMELVRLIL